MSMVRDRATTGHCRFIPSFGVSSSLLYQVRFYIVVRIVMVER